MSRVRILDLDGSLRPQFENQFFPTSEWVPANPWGPRVRLACSFKEFDRFREWLRNHLPHDPGSAVTLYGSGDFHHVTLALLERVPGPFNLLVLDKHPDWMSRIPFLHCGSWLHHALRLPNLKKVFHCGGDLDFDNAYRGLAPWADLESGRVVIHPARRRFRRGRWAGIDNTPLLDEGRLRDDWLIEALSAHKEDLRRLPLYISIDKDVLSAEDAVVNWDSGFLRLPQVRSILRIFLDLAEGRIAGADLVGDWSPVRLGHWLNRICNLLDHPGPLDVDPAVALRMNHSANAALLNLLMQSAAGGDPG